MDSILYNYLENVFWLMIFNFLSQEKMYEFEQICEKKKPDARTV